MRITNLDGHICLKHCEPCQTMKNVLIMKGVEENPNKKNASKLLPLQPEHVSQKLDYADQSESMRGGRETSHGTNCGRRT